MSHQGQKSKAVLTVSKEMKLGNSAYTYVFGVQPFANVVIFQVIRGRRPHTETNSEPQMLDAESQ